MHRHFLVLVDSVVEFHKLHRDDILFSRGVVLGQLALELPIVKLFGDEVNHRQDWKPLQITQVFRGIQCLEIKALFIFVGVAKINI